MISDREELHSNTSSERVPTPGSSEVLTADVRDTDTSDLSDNITLKKLFAKSADIRSKIKGQSHYMLVAN